MITKIDSNAEAKQILDQLRADALGNGAPGATSEAAAKLAIKQVSQLIASDSSLRVTTSTGNRTGEVGVIPGGTGIPELDDVGSRTNVKENLEKLLLFLQLDNDNRMAEMAQARLENQKGTLQTRHDEMKAQIDKNIKAMDKAAKMQKFMKIFGWVMLAVTAVATVVTCGAAIGAAAAAGAAVTAAGQAATQVAIQAAKQALAAAIRTCVFNAISLSVAATSQALQETGKMDDFAKDIAESIRNTFGCKKADSEMWAQIILGAATLVLTMGSGAIGAQGASAATNAAKTATTEVTEAGIKLAETAANTMANVMSSGMTKVAMAVVGTGLTGAGLVGQGLSIDANYEAGMTQADTTELDAVMKRIQQMIEETQEELEAILEQEQGLITKMFGIINSAMEVEGEISNNIGTMA